MDITRYANLLVLIMTISLVMIMYIIRYFWIHGLSSSRPSVDQPVHFVSFAGNGEIHRLNQDLQKIPNKQFIPNLVHAHYINDETIGADYYARLCPLLKDSSRGFHYWSWKPYIIHETMKNSAPGSMIVYLDAGAYLVRDIQPLLEYANVYGRVLFQNLHDNTKYCKCEPVYTQLHTDTERQTFRHTLQLDAAFLILKNTTVNQAFVQEWMDLCLTYSLVSDTTSMSCKEDAGFLDHRHDQALLTLVAFKNQKGQKMLHAPLKYSYIHHHRRRVI